MIEIKFEFWTVPILERYRQAILDERGSDVTGLAAAATKRIDEMTKPIADRAEVALEYPDKFYSGTFERSSRFDASMDATGVLLVLEHPGSEDVRKSVHIHIHYGLLADIIEQLGAQVSKIPANESHRDQLQQAVAQLDRALQTAAKQ